MTATSRAPLTAPTVDQVDGRIRRLTLPEYTRRAYPPLPRAAAHALAATGAVTVAADLDGRSVLASTSYVGTVRAGDVELRVTPKTGIRRLLWLIGHAQDPSGWRPDDLVDLTDTDDITTAVAVSFLAAADRALARGVLQGYRTIDEALPLLRGRLREADQLRHRLALPVPLEVRYDDYTIDTPENRLLLAATLRLLRLPGLPTATRVGLRRLRTLLADVTATVPGEQLPPDRDDRLVRPYLPALRLARLVLAGRSIDQPPGPATASGFLFDLNHVFEDWLTVALRRALHPYGGHLSAQHRTHLDSARSVPIRPDLVWHLNGQPAAVLDAKYKSAGTGRSPREDLYQMLAYCTALDLAAGHLVYAAGPHTPRRHIVRNTAIELRIWALDLAKPIPDLLAEVDDLATAVSAAARRQAGW